MYVLGRFNGQEYIFTYNEQTGYYETTIEAPEIGGIYETEIIVVDSLNNSITTSLDVQVLKKEEIKRNINEILAYFLDKKTFEIKDIIFLQDYEIIIDEETNATSTITIMQKPNIEADDFIFIKEEDEVVYIGIIKEIKNKNGEEKYQISLKYISNLFDRDLIVDNESLISSEGIEDFIKYTIENQFTNSKDKLLNIKFLDVEVNSHTKINKSVDNENGIYNFHTYITNCTQNYNIVLDFKYKNGRLKLNIYREIYQSKLIDTTVSDITNYTEIFETAIVAKVIIKTDTNIQEWYLLNDRTTTQDINNEERAFGKVVTQYTEKEEDAYQTAMNVFKSNTYKHLIEFTLNTNSKLIGVKELKIGTPVKVKTNNNIILETYISAITIKANQKFRHFKSGNMRIKFIEKLNKKGG